MGTTKKQQKIIWSWVLYDWANSAFATTVIAGFFPLFFKQYWSQNLSTAESTSVLGFTNSLASLCLALMAPVLGAIADAGTQRKRFLFAFTLLGALAAIGLGLIGPGEWLLASFVFGLGVIGFTAGSTFYDALLVQITPADRLDRVSGLGYAFGYLGGGVLFALNVFMFSKPEVFGLPDKAMAVRASFVTVGVWWLLFSLPLFLFVPEQGARKKLSIGRLIRTGWTSLREQVSRLRGHRPLIYFLVGYLFYIDGVNTIIKMAVDFGMSIGLESADLIKALLMVQFIGFPAAVLFGFLGEWIGPRRGIWICIGVYLTISLYAYRLSTITEFYMLAVLIGLVQGGIQSLSRSLYARLVPAKDAAQYFGFFNMVGKFSAILGPALVGGVTLWTGNARAGILVISLFFLLGAFLLHQSRRAPKTP